MGTPDRVYFRRTDRLDQKFVAVVSNFAEHFKTPKEHLFDFCTLLQKSSRWNHDNLQEQLTIWLDRFNLKSGRFKATQLIRDAFLLCKNDDEINELRGALLEALVIAHHGGIKNFKLNNEFHNNGWGAKVYVKKLPRPESIYYECDPDAKEGSNCKNRSTVDVGVWDGFNAKFYECKTHPFGIGCKEKKYLQLLSDTMADEKISHELFFVCAETKEAIQMRLQKLQLSLKFQAIGSKELQNIKSA